MSANDFGFKVSLPGFDVKTATPEQCSVHSSYPPLKAKLSQSPPHFANIYVDFLLIVAQNVDHTVYSFNHGYSYTPTCISVLNFIDSGGNSLSGIGEIAVGATLLIEAKVTSTQFLITLYDNATWTSSAASLNVSYFIAAEDGA